MNQKFPLPHQKKISFFNLFKVFRFCTILQWISTVIYTILWYILSATLFNLVSHRNEIKNFADLIPNLLKKTLPKGTILIWGKEEFIAFGLIWVLFYALINYFDNLWEEELQIKGGHYVKNRLLDKFRSLPFEERKVHSSEISTLVEIDSVTVGWYWNHLYNHIFHSALFIILTIWDNRETLVDMQEKTVFLSLVFILIVNVVNFLLLRSILHNEKRHKEALVKENALINKESDKSILIDSMGLISEYQKKQKNITSNNQQLLLSFARTQALHKTLPGRLIESYPFFLLLVTGRIIGRGLFAFYEVFENMREVFHCFQDYGDYNSSLSRVNNFLNLLEKDDNLTGLKLEKKNIDSVTFQNLSFTYRKNNNWILKNYQHNFMNKNINKLFGDNGTGKSTIIYLLLGMLKPNKGQILIHCQGGKTYDLNKDINLKHWREQKVAYCSHENLIEEGSTGQRQITNINNVLKTKSNAEIIIFDEATNALDKENLDEIYYQLEKLAKKGKIIIYTKH